MTTTATTVRGTRDLRLMVGAVGLSALGDWLALTPLAFHVGGQTGSGLAVAALFIAVWAPAALLAGPAGMLVDRVENRALLLGVSLAQAVVAVALAFAGSFALVVVLAALLGCLFALAQPAEFALVPAAAPPGRLAWANARVETARYLGFTVGPLAGGALAAAGGTRVALLVDAASFLAVAGAALVLHARRRPEPARPGDAPARARDGIALLFADRVLGLVLAVAIASLLFMTACVAAEQFFVRDVLGAGEFAYGALTAVWMLGMVAGSLGVGPRIPAHLLAVAALAAIVAQSMGLALAAIGATLASAAAAYLLGGVAHGAKNVLVRTLVHERVPERAHGRAYAAYNGLRNGAELVALVGGGLLVAAAGPRSALLLAGAIPAAIGLAGLAVYARRTRTGALPIPAPATS